jgi:hypothetical protein
MSIEKAGSDARLFLFRLVFRHGAGECLGIRLFEPRNPLLLPGQQGPAIDLMRDALELFAGAMILIGDLLDWLRLRSPVRAAYREEAPRAKRSSAPCRM